MKIKGLSVFQRRVLLKTINAPDKTGDYEINFNDPISLQRLDSLWHGSGTVDVNYKAYIFHIEAIGDVYANLYTVQGDEYITRVKDKCNNGNFGSEMLSYFRSDKSLRRIKDGEHPRYRLEIDYGNWWECSVTDPNGQWHDLTWCMDSDDLFSAISEVLGGCEEIIKNLEEAA